MVIRNAIGGGWRKRDVNGARPHNFEGHGITPKGVKIGSWKAKPQNNKNNNKTNSFYGGSTDIHALHKQIYSMSVVLKSNRGAIRKKYLDWLLSIMEEGQETLLCSMWFIWANSGFQ